MKQLFTIIFLTLLISSYSQCYQNSYDFVISPSLGLNKNLTFLPSVEIGLNGYKSPLSFYIGINTLSEELTTLDKSGIKEESTQVYRSGQFTCLQRLFKEKSGTSLQTFQTIYMKGGYGCGLKIYHTDDSHTQAWFISSEYQQLTNRQLAFHIGIIFNITKSIQYRK